jgi:long-chain fatty acid transport protein
LKTQIKFHLAGCAALLALAGILACPDSVLALGFALPDQDTFATARGNAFVATASDPAAVYYNPAGITQLEGSHFSIGEYGIVYGSSYNTGATGTINSKSQLAVLPQVFSTWSLPYNLTFGLGTYSPFGLRYEWPNNSPFLPVGETAEMDFFTLNPVLAYKVCSSLSLAAGPTLNYSEVDFKEFPGFVNHFRGRDTSTGFNAGALWHPWEQHSFGITYRSASDMNYNGHATSLLNPAANIPAQANIHFPQSVDFGYSYRPTTNWNFEVDADWTDWTQLQNVAINPQSAFGDNLPFYWHPSWILSFGATRNLGSGWRLSGGYMYSENTVPSDEFNPLVPDSDRHIFSLGVGKQYNKFSWDVAYQLSWGPNRTISNDYYPPVNGTYEFLSHAISINFGYRF